MSTPGYYCVICHKWLPETDGVIVHDPIPHPPEMTFDEQENPMRDTADIKNLHYHAFNYRNAHSTQAGNDFNLLEEFVSKLCIAAGEKWRDEWSEGCNDNQILHNTIKTLITQREDDKQAMANALEALVRYQVKRQDFDRFHEVIPELRGRLDL